MRRFGEAIESEQQALDISREIGYPYREGVALYHLGEAYCDVGRLEELWIAIGKRWRSGGSLAIAGMRREP